MKQIGVGWIVFILICIQLFSRYLSTSAPSFSSDDWAQFARYSEAAQTSIANTILSEPDRVTQTVILRFIYNVFGNQPYGYWVLSMLAYSLLMLCGCWLIWLLTNSSRKVLVYGLLMCIWPNLTESFHWCAMITIAYTQISYVLSAVFWAKYCQSSYRRHLLLSFVFYAIAISSYEVGIALPLAFIVLLKSGRQKKSVIPFLGYALVFAIYALWRFTHAFGMAHTNMFPSRVIQFSAYALKHNVYNVISWWIGPDMFQCVVNGLSGFVTLAPRTMWILIIVNSIIAYGCYLLLSKASLRKANTTNTYRTHKTVFFGIAWFLLANFPILISWAAGRMNLLPALGLSIGLASICGEKNKMIHSVLIPCALWVCMFANQGTAKQWKDASQLQEQLYCHLQKTEEKWQDKEIILFDTSNLRKRLTTSLLHPADDSTRTWAYYGNAGLIRGFVPTAMLKLIKPKGYKPTVVLDTECNASNDQTIIYWYARYDTNKVTTTLIRNAYIVDCLTAKEKTVRL